MRDIITARDKPSSRYPFTALAPHDCQLVQITSQSHIVDTNGDRGRLLGQSWRLHHMGAAPSKPELAPPSGGCRILRCPQTDSQCRVVEDQRGTSSWCRNRQRGNSGRNNHIANSDGDPLQKRLATSPSQRRKPMTTHPRIRPTRWQQWSVLGKPAPCRLKNVGWQDDTHTQPFRIKEKRDQL